uniref:Secreted protein n=1 Tax=Globodera pallida TaxID=36090 RepID=A0A183CTT5_GLOPA
VLCPSADFTVHANFCLFALHEQQCQRCGQAACCRWASVRHSPEFYVDKTSEANQLGIRDQISGWRRSYNSTWAAFDHSFLTNSIYEHSASPVHWRGRPTISNNNNNLALFSTVFITHVVCRLCLTTRRGAVRGRMQLLVTKWHDFFTPFSTTFTF